MSDTNNPINSQSSPQQPPLEQSLSGGRVFGLFSVPFFKGTLNLPHETVARDCIQICASAKDNHGNPIYTTYFDEKARLAMYQFSWWPELKKQLFALYTEYQQAVNDIVLDDTHKILLFAWVSRYQFDESHNAHIHEYSCVSGTYYPLARTDAIPIVFKSPHEMASMLFAPESDDKNNPNYEGCVLAGHRHNHLSARCYPRTGDVLLWPSYVPHEIDSARKLGASKSHDRIAISFNLSHCSKIIHNEDEPPPSGAEVPIPARPRRPR